MISDPTSPALRLPTGQQVYDALMGEIEQELLAGRVQGEHPDETPEQREARNQKYLDAFARYDRAFAALAAELRQAVDACRKTAKKRPARPTRKIAVEAPLPAAEPDALPAADTPTTPESPVTPDDTSDPPDA